MNARRDFLRQVLPVGAIGAVALKAGGGAPQVIAYVVAWALFAASPTPRIDAATTTLLVAGLLVGAGTRYGSGCTSGHGVCGLARLSPRSLAAVLVFMATGAVSATFLRPLLP